MDEELIDRFARGELPPAEARDLAQLALGDHDLFDELTSTAIARRALATREHKKAAWPRIAIIGLAAAVILGVVLRTPWRTSQPVRPAVAISAPPILLAGNADSNATSFRGPETGSREPRTTGSVESIADAVVTIDLGSLDGLTKDGQAEVVRDGQVIGQIKLTTLFRDHSRGEIVAVSPVRAKDQVRVPAAARLRANLDQIQAALTRGEPEKAMDIAKHSSIETLDADLSGAQDLNNAGVIAELHGDNGKAIELYQRASQANPPEKDRQAIETNLRRVKGGK